MTSDLEPTIRLPDARAARGEISADQEPGGQVLRPPVELTSAQAGQHAVPDSSKPKGRRLGSRYWLEARIGRGATGEVWRASVLPGTEAVAVKLLRGELSSDPEVVAQFLRERTLLLGLQGDHLVRVRDLVVDDDDIGIVMDLVEGGDLRRHLRAAGTLAPSDAVALVVQLLEGLALIHAAGVIHRDVKPENVLLENGPDESLVVRLTDFGIARASTSQSLSRLTGLIGTPDYMAPEVVNEGRAGVAADLYGAGVVLYELLAGHTPFGGGHPVAVLRRHLEEPPRRPTGCPDALWSVLASLLAKQPADRPASATTAIAMLVATRPAIIGHPRLPVQEPPLREPGIATHPGDPRPTSTPTVARLAAAPTRPVALHPRAPTLSRRLGRRPRGVIALAVVLTLVAGTWVIIRGRSTRLQTATPATVQLSFSPSVLPNGIVLTRSWSYDPASGVLASALHLLNPTTAPITGDVDEVVAKSLATSTASIRFSTQPTATVQVDPVVRYHVSLGANAIDDIHYEIALTAGASRSRLEQLLADEAGAYAAYQPTTTLATLLLTPATLVLPVHGTGRVNLAGTMSDGTTASADILDAVLLTSSNPSVATVSGLTVTGVATGMADVMGPSDVRGDPVAVTVRPEPSPSASSITNGPVASKAPSPSPTMPTTPRPTPKPSPTGAPPPPTPSVGPTPTPTPTPTPMPSPTPTPQRIPVTMYSCGPPAATIVNTAIHPGGSVSQAFSAGGNWITDGYVTAAQAPPSSASVEVRLDGPAGPIASVSAPWNAQQGSWIFSFGSVAVASGGQYTFSVLNLGSSEVVVMMNQGASSGCLVGEIHGLQ